MKVLYPIEGLCAICCNELSADRTVDYCGRSCRDLYRLATRIEAGTASKEAERAFFDDLKANSDERSERVKNYLSPMFRRKMVTTSTK